MIKTKGEVSLASLKPEVATALPVFESLYWGFGLDCVVTSTNDGKHKTNSLHYKDLAFDIRSRTLTRSQIDYVVAKAKSALPNFDIVYEGDHIHAEYDPK